MSEIKWQAPPIDKRRSQKWPEIRSALRKRPNEWALVSTQPNASNGNPKRHLGHEYEVTVRSNGEHFDVYARFVGEQP